MTKAYVAYQFVDGNLVDAKGPMDVDRVDVEISKLVLSSLLTDGVEPTIEKGHDDSITISRSFDCPEHGSHRVEFRFERAPEYDNDADPFEL